MARRVLRLIELLARFAGFLIAAAGGAAALFVVAFFVTLETELAPITELAIRVGGAIAGLAMGGWLGLSLLEE